MKRVLILNLGCDDPLFLIDFGLECIEYCLMNKIKLDYVINMRGIFNIESFTEKSYLLQQGKLHNNEIYINTFFPHATLNGEIESVVKKCLMHNEYDLILSIGYHKFLKNLFTKSRLSAPLVIVDMHMLGDVKSFLPDNNQETSKLFKSNPIQIISCFQNYSTFYKRYGIPLNRIKWVNYCCNYKFYKPLPQFPESNYIFCGGNHLRDHELLMQTVEENELFFIKNKIIIKLFAPKPPINLKKNEVLIYAGFVEYKILIEALKNSRFMILPLKDVAKKANGLTMLGLALALGKAVIVTKNKATSTHIIDGFNGLFVEPGNSDDLFKKVKHLIENPDKIKYLGENARKSGEKDMSFDYLIKIIFETNWKEKIIVLN